MQRKDTIQIGTQNYITFEIRNHIAGGVTIIHTLWRLTKIHIGYITDKQMSESMIKISYNFFPLKYIAGYVTKIELTHLGFTKLGLERILYINQP